MLKSEQIKPRPYEMEAARPGTGKGSVDSLKRNG